MPPRRNRDNDTIVVKGDGDEDWTAPSSPESVGSDIDFQPKDKMAIDSPQNLESPEPEQADESSIASASPGSMPKYLNQISFRDPGSSTMEERLQMMPAKRPLPWRDGVEAGSELETGGDSRRKQIRFGCLLATRGNLVPSPCVSCANGRGKFELCIALPGFFKGACASCQLSGRPNRCSIKSNEDIEPEDFNPEDGIRSSPVAQASGSESRRASGSSRKNAIKVISDRSSSSQENISSGPPAKRARVEEPEKPEKPPQTGWQEPPVVDTGLGSTKSRGGRPPRSSLNHIVTPWAHVNSPHMATRNSSTPINTRNGGSRRSVGRPSSATKETTAKETTAKEMTVKEATVKESTRKPSSTPGTETPQSAPSRSASTSWASVNQTQQGSQPTFPNLPKLPVPKPQHQQAKPEQQKARPEQQPADPEQPPANPEQQQAQSQQQQAQPPQNQAQAYQQQQQQQQHQAQQPPYPGQQQYRLHPHPHPQPHPQLQQSQPQQGPPPPQFQSQPQQGPPQPLFQVQPINAPMIGFGNFADQQNTKMSNGSTTSQPAKKGKPYQPSFSSGLTFAAAPLIETIPRRKQLQLMGIISGLQGGIDNIQRELNQLKKTLGVEEDEN